jgi:hypothetical protein
MTSLIDDKLASAVRRAAVRATLAPSVHNTQPWQFRFSSTTLDVHADWNRRLRVLDPRGRHLMLSCGCAVFTARVALAATGYNARIERFPDPTRPTLVARLTLPEPVTAGIPIATLEPMIESRHTNRRRFADQTVPVEVVDALSQIATDEGAELFAITRPEHRLATARLSQHADNLENIDPAYRAELRAWTSDDLRRRDGVPAKAVPHVAAGKPDEVPIRDFDTHGNGRLPSDTHSSAQQCLLLLGTRQDTPVAWLHAGEALQHVLLELTRRGYAASPLTQVTEVAATNVMLRQELHLSMFPHVLLRVGRPPPTPATRRRRLVDMLEEFT